MGRQVKQGLDYFTVDVDFFDSIKIRRIRKDCGNQSITLLIALLCNIYREEGYYVGYDSDLAFLIAEQFGVSEGVVEETVKKAVSVGFFDADMFRKYNILTSHSIQERYFIAVDKLKRKRVTVTGDFMLKSVIECGYVDKLGENAVFPRDKSNKSLNKSDYVKVKVNVKGNVKGKADVNKTIVENTRHAEVSKHVIDYLNERTGKHFKANTAKTQTLIHARLAEGFTETDFFTVIDKKAQEWLGDSKMDRYLRPETLFGTKFEGYLNEQTIRPQQTKAQKRINATRYLVGELTEMERLHEGRDSSVAGEDDTGILPARSVETVPEY